MEKEKDVALLLGVVIISLGALVVLNNAQRIAEPVLDCQAKQERIDSLIAEIEMRDMLLSRCKDSTYGEEVIH